MYHIITRFRMWGKYTVEPLGEWWVVRRHGLFWDCLVNLELPHLHVRLKGDPYFNHALGQKETAERVCNRLNGVKAYG